jgi:hypothetical protein
VVKQELVSDALAIQQLESALLSNENCADNGLHAASGLVRCQLNHERRTGVVVYVLARSCCRHIDLLMRYSQSESAQPRQAEAKKTCSPFRERATTLAAQRFSAQHW